MADIGAFSLRGDQLSQSELADAHGHRRADTGRFASPLESDGWITRRMLRTIGVAKQSSGAQIERVSQKSSIRRQQLRHELMETFRSGICKLACVCWRRFANKREGTDGQPKNGRGRENENK